MNLANLITLARLISVPVIVWAILAGEMGLAFGLFVAAGISDAVDGFIAKRFHTETVVGSYLDPLADKALIMSVYLSLGHEGYLPMYLVILVVFRDMLIVGGVLLLFTLNSNKLRVEPLLISKANTAGQIVLAAVVLGGEALGMPQPMALSILVWVITTTTILSGASYIVQGSRKLPTLEDRR